MPLTVKGQSSECDKHATSVASIFASNGAIVSGSDDGILKLWSPDLKSCQQVDTEHGGIFSIAADADVIYTCQSDETIQSWDKKTFKSRGEVKTSLFCPLKLFYDHTANILWAGDSHGAVAKIEDGQESNKFDLTEEIWDLYVTSNPTLVFTARDRDVLVSEIVKGELRSNAITKATMEGRYPMAKVGDFFCCLDREGRKIQVHDFDVASKFKIVREITASELIMNAMCPGEGNSIYTGGYDSKVSLWDVASSENLGNVEVGSCVNALAATENGAYVALTDGRVLLVGL